MGCYVRVGLLMRRKLGQVRLRLWGWIRHLQREAKTSFPDAGDAGNEWNLLPGIIEVAKWYCGLTAKKGLWAGQCSTRVLRGELVVWARLKDCRKGYERSR